MSNNQTHCCDCTTEMAEVLCKLKDERVAIYEKNNNIVVGTISKIIDCSVVLVTDAQKFTSLGFLPIGPIPYNKVYISICDITEVALEPITGGGGYALVQALETAIQRQA